MYNKLPENFRQNICKKDREQYQRPVKDINDRINSFGYKNGVMKDALGV